MKTPYEQFKEANCEIDNHESDLYIKVTDKSTDIASQNFEYKFKMFEDQNGDLWMDFPFLYDPWWKEKSQKKNKKLR